MLDSIGGDNLELTPGMMQRLAPEGAIAVREIGALESARVTLPFGWPNDLGGSSLERRGRRCPFVPRH